MKTRLLLLLALLLPAALRAQTYPMNSSPVSTCAGTFTDSGGSDGPYANSQNLVKTFSPATPGARVRVRFTSFRLADTDLLRVYDGSTLLAPVLGTFTGATLPGVLQASGPNGSLTFVFQSTGTGTDDGWTAVLSCVGGSGGNVGIGVTDPLQKLEVSGEVYSNAGGFRFPDNSVQTTAAVPTPPDNLGNHTATQNLNLTDKLLVGGTAAAPGTQGLSLSSTGHVGIGTAPGTAASSPRLDVAGDVRADGQHSYATAQPRRLVLGPADFVAPNTTEARLVMVSLPTDEIAYSIYQTGTGSGSYFAPVRLPQGATVTGLSFRALSNDFSNENFIEARLVWRTATPGSGNTLAGGQTSYVSLTGDGGNIREASSGPLNVPIDNAAGTVYQLQVRSTRNANVALYSVTITYTVGQAD